MNKDEAYAQVAVKVAELKSALSALKTAHAPNNTYGLDEFQYMLDDCMYDLSAWAGPIVDEE